ncbi:hypothetical protein [Paenibacillus tepidiphilus]|uniref:hypothetical protein n=1 Tax=Paenibacillus tepidiphilus TaxID=2608683 RepID=UPI00123A7C5D|nr:hypothetical protein [Paenibacillus tepidiphilus]
MDKLKADMVSEINSSLEDESDIKMDEVEFESLNDIMWFERENRKFQNVIKAKAALVLELIQDSSQVLESKHPARTKHEVSGGVKKAIQRGARLNEVEVFNLYFRFITPLINADGPACMYRSLSSSKERILLLPDDTRVRIEKEVEHYKREALSLVFSGLMNPDEQSSLLDNLNMINVHERCAQSLQHEYGHVLNIREFDSLNYSPYMLEEIYLWFLHYGYLHCVEKRYPYFVGLTAIEKIHILKESLVEDYRISLNMGYERGKFILPNVFCFSGDFQDPSLLSEGVDIMKRMLNNQIVSSDQKPASFQEEDTLEIIRKVSNRRKKYNWSVPDKTSLTDEQINDDLKSLRALSEAAASKIRL